MDVNEGVNQATKKPTKGYLLHKKLIKLIQDTANLILVSKIKIQNLQSPRDL